ncbi:MAG: EAL domain-containing protein, partial [Oscillospiraceae bacterium]
MIRNKLKAKPSAIIILIILFASIVTSIVSYRHLLENDLSSASCNTLSNVLEQQQYSMNTKLLDQSEAIATYASLLSNTGGDANSIFENIKIMANNSSFDFVSYADKSGNAIENTGAGLNISDRDYFKRAIKGEFVISDPVVSKTTHKDIITFSAPVRTGSEITGVLVGVYDAANLSSLLMPTFSGKGFTFVTSSDGVVILKTQTNNSLSLYTNLFNTLKDMKVYEHDNIGNIETNVKFGKSGHISFMLNGEKHLMHYMPVGINNWYIFSEVSQDIISAQSTSIMKRTTILAGALTLMYLVVLIYILFDQKRHVSELSNIAFKDTLTGKANRKKFRIVADELIKANKHKYAFVILDIDKFKVLNDTLGYENGNQTLLCIANAIESNVYNEEFFGRGDSDEYYMLLKCSDNKSLEIRVKHIISECKAQFSANVSEFYNLIICAGIYVITDASESINTYSDRAKHAQQLIKGSQISTVAFYSEEIREHLLREKQIENAMFSALDNEDFILYLQPKYTLNGEKICGAEALVRWRNSDDTMMYPDEFIPVFEKNGFVIKLDFYMLEAACKCIRHWIDTGLSPIPISVNFSRLHLQDEHFVEKLSEIVNKYAISPSLIEVELTESTVLNNEGVLIDVISQLHSYGFSLSIDDFGSGYSSLGLLKNLAVDIIKLDRTFFAQYSDLRRAKIVIHSM